MKFEPELLGYQRRAISFIKERMNSALWADMGLGKTVSTLTALVQLRAEFDMYKTLVVAPLRVARKVWADEINEWDHLKHLRCSVICGTPKQRLAAIAADADIYCVNRENFAWLCQQFVIREHGRLKQMTGSDRCVRCDGIDGEHDPACPMAKMIRDIAAEARDE